MGKGGDAREAPLASRQISWQGKTGLIIHSGYGCSGVLYQGRPMSQLPGQKSICFCVYIAQHDELYFTTYIHHDPISTRDRRAVHSQHRH